MTSPFALRMSLERPGKLCLLALFCAQGAHAERLPPLTVDPALIGLPPVPASATLRPAGSAATTMPRPDSVTRAPSPEGAAAPGAPAAATAQPARTVKSPVPSTLGPVLGDEAVIEAERFSGLNEREAIAEGHVELTKRDARLQADRLVYRSESDEVEATGNVRLSRGGERMSGPRLELHLNDDTGVFEQPEYQIQRTVLGDQTRAPNAGLHLPTGSGHAAALHFEGKGQYRLSEATYSTCPANADGSFDWFAKVGDLQLDYVDETGTGHDASLVFQGVPILYSPWLTFPLNNRRKSGLLTPTIGSSSNTGFEYSQPVYWNIAPNLDATIVPRLMSKRGLQLGGEFRYLGANYAGEAEVEYLPNDTVFDDSRSRVVWRHAHNFGGGFRANINFQEVSDDTYFSDLSTRLSTISQTNLLRQATLSYDASWWHASVAALSYQTLQDPDLPRIAPPYRRMPQITVGARRFDLPGGLDAKLAAEYVEFQHPYSAEGSRASLYPQLSLPMHGSAWFVTPKVGVRALRYDISRYRAYNIGGPDNLATSVTVPIASVDSGVVLERDSDWLGTPVIQTLEPRLYYLYAPARDQTKIPAFDTAVADFNFAQIFSESRYVGGDRIADANQLTAMVTSRLIDPETGAERMRAGFGQRFYFSDQQVGLPAEVLRTDHRTDLLAAFSGQILPSLYFDTAWQYNQRKTQTERLNIGARFQPGPGKVLNAGYRYAREAVGAPLSGFGQVDLSGQWPLGGRWHGVGRYNYSTKDNRVIEALGGVEYDGGCWVARAVVQRTATLVRTSNTALFFQLELNDFSRIGSNPLDLLKRSVPGYDAITGSVSGRDDGN